MLSFEDLPDTARLWIYPASRALNSRELTELEPKLEAFAASWTGHRRDLRAYAGVWSERFLVIGVDETSAAASGCSIDASVRFVRSIGEVLGVDFFDRMTFYVKVESAIRAYPAGAFAEAYEDGELTDASTVIDPLVTSKAAALAGFEKPLADSWHARFVGA